MGEMMLASTVTKPDVEYSEVKETLQTQMVASQLSASHREDALLHFGMEMEPNVITRASGSWIYTESGARVLDWTSDQLASILGHGHPEIVETVVENAKNLDHLYSAMLSKPVLELAKLLCSTLPPGLDKAFFLSTGSKSNEAAIRLAKLFTGKFEIVALSSSWHGMSGASVGAQYLYGRKGYGPPMPGNLMIPFPNAGTSPFRNRDGTHAWREELDYGFAQVDQASCGSLAAMIVEPILSSGGVHVLPEGYLAAVRDHCNRRAMLMILDEAQTAIGRAGSIYSFEPTTRGASQVWQPDILTLGKTLGNGYPLSAVVVSNLVAETCRERGFSFCTTHTNDPLAAAVGLQVLKIVLRDDLCRQARVLGGRMMRSLQHMADDVDCIEAVRGRGLLVGVQLRRVGPPGWERGFVDLGRAIVRRMFRAGLWVHFSAASGTFRIAPPLTTSEEELEAGLHILRDAFVEAQERRLHFLQSSEAVSKQ